MNLDFLIIDCLRKINTRRILITEAINYVKFVRPKNNFNKFTCRFRLFCFEEKLPKNIILFSMV